MFKISRRLDYGVQLMIALAADKECKPRSTASIAKKLNIPLPFLHQISHSLMQTGFIKATPGPRGGLRLNRPASSISALNIVEALEGPINLNQTKENQTQDNGISSITQEMWDKIQQQIVTFLEQQKLDKLAKSNQDAVIFSLPIKSSEIKEAISVN